MSGQAKLLGIDDICKRLGISRTTFDRWVRNSSGKSTLSPNTVHLMILMAFLRSMGGGGLSVRCRRGNLLIFRLTPRMLRLAPRLGRRS
jgi:predicted DNA-binding transcriptional regulator AlpA